MTNNKASTTNSSGKKGLRQFDAFPKVDFEYIKPTTVGSISTIIVAIIITYLVLTELNFQFNNKQLKTEFIIEPSTKNEIMFNFDIRVAMKCSELNFNFSHSSMISDYNYNKHVEFREISGKEAFEHGLSFQSREGKLLDIESCALTGILPIQKRNGEAVISPKGHGQGGAHVPHNKFDFTHKIKRLSFGNEHPTLKNLLDNELKISETIMDEFQYYLTIVPTIYVDINQRTTITNQYTVLQSKSKSSMKGAPPAIHFTYEIEPILVRYTEYKQAYSVFIVHLCSIVSGLWVISMLVNRMVIKVMENYKAI